MNGGLRKTSRYLLAGVSALGLLSFGGTAAKAASVEQLEAAMKAMQAQMQQLQKEVAAAKAAAAAAQQASSGGGGSGLDLKVKWKGAPELASTDGKFKFKVRGRLQTDYNGIDQDESITGEGDISAVEIRRARIGVEGVVFYDWKYKFEIDFAGGDAAIKDAYIAYANWANWEKSEIIVGNFKTANSMEQLTSSRFITFLERAAFTDAFFLDRQIGAGIWAGNEHWSFQTGYYGATPIEENGIPGQENFDTDQTAFTIRGTVAPINNDTAVVHLGGSWRHRDAGTLRDCGATLCVGGPNALFQYRARGADLHLADRFVDTPQFADSDDMFVLEGAVVWKSLYAVGEYSQIEANSAKSIADNIDPTYDGWYVEAGWFITGEMRPYAADEGVWERIKPKNPFYGGSGGWGAWQLAGRYDVIDLSDKAAAIANFGVVNCNECGEQKTWLLGLNWWATDYTAIKLQVSQSEIEGGVNDGAEITGVGVRAQVDW
ncbi:MAG: OprO/OprP family phosphate-selective porin [Methyloceanibacter sp.]|uniref:OprO/OprP family phosphate-selective porin n=1 Tax=Methyloceanibacter sp. TaxID=1965321 RepID=UPI003D6CE8CA